MTNEETAGQLLAATKDEDTMEAAFFDRGPKTLTISDVDKGAIKGKKGKPKPYLKFANTQLKLFIPKITVICLTQMFGVRLKDWVGKRVVLHQSKCNGVTGKRVPCVRVWGSPDIERDIPIDMLMGSEHVNIVIRAGLPEKTSPGAPTKTPGNESTGSKSTSIPENNSATETNQQQSRAAAAEPDPALIDAWSALGWSREDGAAHLQEFIDKFPETNYLNHLGLLIDEENAKEGTF